MPSARRGDWIVAEVLRSRVVFVFVLVLVLVLVIEAVRILDFDCDCDSRTRTSRSRSRRIRLAGILSEISLARGCALEFLGIGGEKRRKKP